MSTARETSAPLLTPVHDAMTCPWALAERVRTSPDAPLISRKSSVGGRWREMSARAFHDQVRQVAAGLAARGPGPE